MVGSLAGIGTGLGSPQDAPKPPSLLSIGSAVPSCGLGGMFALARARAWGQCPPSTSLGVWLEC